MELRHFSSKMNRRASAANHLMKQVHIPDEVYRELAEKLRIEVEYGNPNANYIESFAKGYMFNTFIEVEAEHNEIVHTLSATVNAYFNTDRSPCGRPLSELDEIRILWIECRSMTEWDGEAKNDFDTRKLKVLL